MRTSLILLIPLALVGCGGDGGSTASDPATAAPAAAPTSDPVPAAPIAPPAPQVLTNNVLETDGNVSWYEFTVTVPAPNSIVGLSTTTVVPSLPPVPASSGAYISYWPGLSPIPNGPNYLPIGNGVMQPIITTFAPFTSWWASSIYDNPTGGTMPEIYSGYQSITYPQEIDGLTAAGTDSFSPQPGDAIYESMQFTSDVPSSYGSWTITITDDTTGESNTLYIDMRGQSQNLAYFAIESWYGMQMGGPVTFKNTTLMFALPDDGTICTAAIGVLDKSGLNCLLNEIVLQQ